MRSVDWGKFKTQLEKVGQKIETAGKEYAVLAGTRTNTLERPLRRIEELEKREVQLIEKK